MPTVDDGLRRFFDISIHDSNGTDISDRTLVRHHNYTGSNSSPQRVHSRTVSRPQNQCPHPYWPIFEGSRCRHEFSPQSYIMTCTGEHDITYDWVSGRCADSEICVNGQITRESVNGHWWVAYCVNTENFVAIAQDQTGTVANFNAASGKSGYVVEALLTGLDSRTSLVAQSLKIQAQAYELISNTHVWGTLANGSYECANCASVEIPSVPIGTQRIKVNLVLRTASAGLLYLASIVSL